MANKVVYLTTVVVLYLVTQINLANALTVCLEPAVIDLSTAGATFKIDVMIEDVTNLGGFQFEINYNTAIVTVDNASDVVLGPFLGTTGRNTGSLGPNIDNVGGNVTFGAYSFGANPGPNGDGLLSTFTFTIQSKANGVLDLSSVQVVDTSVQTMKVDTIGDSKLFRNRRGFQGHLYLLLLLLSKD